MRTTELPSTEPDGGAGSPRRGVDESVLIGGREHRDITLVDYDPAWPARFELERARILGALGATALRVEHIGSTAVPGLSAKAIVDLLVVVADVDAEAGYVPALVAAGYVLRVREPGHRLLRTPALDVHVHVRPGGHRAVRDQLAFRDRLRTDPGDRALYLATKTHLAQRDWPTMNDYADAKTAVITRILGRVGGHQPDGAPTEPAR